MQVQDGDPLEETSPLSWGDQFRFSDLQMFVQLYGVPKQHFHRIL